MKYVVILGDGMADTPVPALGEKTPLEAAHIPHMDFLAQHGTVGMAKTVPDGMKPGSDTANLSVLGYDPLVCYTGRSPLEAVAMGINLADDDIAMRCNLVTLSEEAVFEKKTMVDYSSDEISTEEATELISALQKELSDELTQFTAGISYRHCLVLHHEKTGTCLTPPHDITGKPIADHLPTGRSGQRLLDMMKRSYDILKDHPVNIARRERGLHPANSCWFWGEGIRPLLEPFNIKYGKKAGMICAVDLLKGIGQCAGMENVPVEGATGGMWTNFAGKADGAWKLLTEKGCDLVYIHIEAPDECGHHGDPAAKIRAIEAIDKNVVQRLMDRFAESGEDYAFLLTPDHPTPIETKTHSSAPIPFVIYRSYAEGDNTAPCYTEQAAGNTGLFLSHGYEMMETLLSK